MEKSLLEHREKRPFAICVCSLEIRANSWPWFPFSSIVNDA